MNGSKKISRVHWENLGMVEQTVLDIVGKVLINYIGEDVSIVCF